MPIIIVVILALAISYFFPSIANALVWILTLAFIIPFFTFVGGTFAWALANIITGASFWGWAGWWSFCTFVGLPTGILAAFWVHAD